MTIPLTSENRSRLTARTFYLLVLNGEYWRYSSSKNKSESSILCYKEIIPELDINDFLMGFSRCMTRCDMNAAAVTAERSWFYSIGKIYCKFFY